MKYILITRESQIIFDDRAEAFAYARLKGLTDYYVWPYIEIPTVTEE